MLKIYFLIIVSCFTFMLHAQTPAGNLHAQTPADCIDPRIGVMDDRNSNCVIGPRLPYSSISPSPQTPGGGADGYAPGKPITGFGQLHVSGTGWSSYGHFLVSPQTGVLSPAAGGHLSPHSEDIAKSYYYSTRLDRYGIRTEIAPAHYSAMYRFGYGAARRGHLLFDACQAIATDIVPEMHGIMLGAETTIDSAAREVRMHLRYAGGWPEGAYDVYCVARCSNAFADWGVFHGDTLMRHQDAVAIKYGDRNHCGAYCTFNTPDSMPVQMKLAVSFVSAERAAQLLDDEMPGWNFDEVKDRGKRQWDDRLSAIAVEAPADSISTIFYSALYRVFTAVSDRRLDNPYDPSSSRPYYDDNYAYWDTFRSLYPLLMLVDAPTVAGNINAAIDIFNRDGNVYDGFIAGRSRRGDQGGDDIDHVIAEACLKDIPGVDWRDAYRIVKYHADHCRTGYQGQGRTGYRQMGYIPERSMSSSQTLEYAYNDYSAALMAHKLGMEADYRRYLERSGSWRNLWNKDLQSDGFRGFIDARRADGTFAFFDPAAYGGSWDKPYYEANSWTYSFYVPHDTKALIKLMGGRRAFCDRLAYGLSHRLINNRNEPGFLTTFLFTEARRPDLSSYWSHRIMSEGYDLKGYPENDDTGSMSSWYVFAAIGLFPNAGQDYYYLTAPAVKSATLRLSNGNTLTIKANASAENVYIASCRFNGKTIKGGTIPHSLLCKGGVLEFTLTDKACNR